MKSEPTEPGILFHVKSRVAHIVVNNPAKRNAMSLQMWRDLSSAVDRAGEESSAKVLVISGSGDKSFISGADISKFGKERSNSTAGDEYTVAMEAAIGRLASIPKPVIAMIRGTCYGGGVDLAVGCDLRICSQDAVFCIPAARIGLAYRLTSIQRLINIVGHSFAREMLLTAQKISSERAHQIGLVNLVVAGPPLEQEVNDKAQQLADNAPLSINSAKFGLSLLETRIPDSEAEAHHRLVSQATDSKDYREGIQAFMEKRKPRFEGF